MFSHNIRAAVNAAHGMKSSQSSTISFNFKPRLISRRVNSPSDLNFSPIKNSGLKQLSPFTTAKRYQTVRWPARYQLQNDWLGDNTAAKKEIREEGRELMHDAWTVEALPRLMGERWSQRSAQRQSKNANRHRFLFNWHTNLMRRSRMKHMHWRRQRPNWSEATSYDNRWKAKLVDDLGPDAVYKYKPNPLNIKFRSFAIHPRPIESNLVTGNEKTADKILPPDYMDRIFNQTEAILPLNERFSIRKDKFHYDVNDYRAIGLFQRFLSRFFHVGMPYTTEPLNLPFFYRRRFHGSNEVWVSGCWIDRREINDFFTIISLYTIGVPGIALAKQQLEAEKLQGSLVHERDGMVTSPIEMRTRLIQDSDRTKKPTFEPIQPLPRMPLLD